MDPLQSSGRRVSQQMEVSSGSTAWRTDNLLLDVVYDDERVLRVMYAQSSRICRLCAAQSAAIATCSSVSPFLKKSTDAKNSRSLKVFA